MLTEPDMQARYVAATLSVIEAELRKIDTPAAGRSALVALVTGAARVAARLARDLDRPGGETLERPPVGNTACSNVLTFRR